MLGCFNPNLGQIWTNNKCWVKNAIKKFTVESESWSWIEIGKDIFNPTFEVVHILPKFGFKHSKHFLSVAFLI